MKTKFTICIVLFINTVALIGLDTQMQRVADSSMMDFWIGNRDLSWENPDGSLGKVTNEV
jgi:hypothetical protein